MWNWTGLRQQSQIEVAAGGALEDAFHRLLLANFFNPGQRIEFRWNLSGHAQCKNRQNKTNELAVHLNPGWRTPLAASLQQSCLKQFSDVSMVGDGDGQIEKDLDEWP
ncbi:MAG: hypothetical protein ABI411_16345 [Tahibacter sp.]